MIKKYLALFLGVLVVGCSSVTPNYTKTGSTTLPAKPEGCEVDIYTAMPDKRYIELGVVDMDLFYGVFDFFTKPKAKKASDVKELVAGYVCGAGGNGILLWEANGAGYYTKATIVSIHE